MKIASKVVSAALLLAALIHLVPLAGVLGADTLATLYGLDFSEPNLSILMRHRAVLGTRAEAETALRELERRIG